MKWETGMSCNDGAFIHLDPRTKLYMLLTFNIIMLTSLTEGITIYLKPILVIMSFIFIFSINKRKISIVYISLYVLSYNVETILEYIPSLSILGFIIRFFTHIITRMLPGAMFAYYVLSTTKVSELVAAMERLHISQKIIIPFSVLFRFFPTIALEYKSIKDAMKMRSINFKNGPIAMLEYRFVPLIISVVKIGEELSAASITRGLGNPIKRTNYCKIGFKLLDYIFIIFMTLIIVLYFIL